MLGDRDVEMEGLLAAARERELRLILDEERAERRLARARQRLDSALRRFERAERRVERRRRRLMDAKSELRDCQACRASGSAQTSSPGQEDRPDSGIDAADLPLEKTEPDSAG